MYQKNSLSNRRAYAPTLRNSLNMEITIMYLRQHARIHWSLIVIGCHFFITAQAIAAGSGLIGYWPLQGDCRDHSGSHLDGVNHGVDLKTSEFDGRGAFIEIADAPSLQLGSGDFS